MEIITDISVIFLIAEVSPVDKAYHKILVDRILKLCEGRGLSINKLAVMSGVSQSTLNSIMNGKALNPRIATLHKVAIAFNMTVAEFLNYPELNEYSFEDGDDE